MMEQFRTSLQGALRRFGGVLRWTITAALILIGLSLITGDAAGVKLARALCAWAVLGIGLVLPSGVATGDLDPGTAGPSTPSSGSLPSFYARRILVLQLVTLCLVLMYVPLLLTTALVDGVPLWTAIRSSASAPVVGLLAGLMTAAFSCWGVTMDAVVALMYIFLTSAAGAPFVFERMTLGGDTVVRHLIFPADALHAFGRGVDIPENLGIVLAHFAVWSAVAGLGLVRLNRRSGRPETPPKNG